MTTITTIDEFYYVLQSTKDNIYNMIDFIDLKAQSDSKKASIKEYTDAKIETDKLTEEVAKLALLLPHIKEI